MIPATIWRYSRRDSRLHERGATMLEMAIALPVFFVFLLGMMDMSVHLMTQGLLNQAALSALNMASKLQGVDNWTEGVPAGGVSANRFNQVMQQIEQEALRVVSASFIEPASADETGGWVQFLGSTRQVAGEDVQSTLLLLRPTESGAFISTDGESHAVAHPTLQTGDGNQVQLLKSHPLHVELRAVQRPLLWFLPDMEIRAVASGFREINSANERAAQALLELDNPPDEPEDEPLNDNEEDEEEAEPICVVDQAVCIDLTNEILPSDPRYGLTMCPHPEIIGSDGKCRCMPCYLTINL